MNRTVPLRRHRRVGAAARARIAQGGPISLRRPALSRAGYEALRALIRERAGERCEACSSADMVTGELEHAVPRSAGGADSWSNCWLPCRTCADMKVGTYARGRLLVFVLGDGSFEFQRVQGAKRAYTILLRKLGGRAATVAERAILGGLR